MIKPLMDVDFYPGVVFKCHSSLIQHPAVACVTPAVEVASESQRMSPDSWEGHSSGLPP